MDIPEKLKGHAEVLARKQQNTWSLEEARLNQWNLEEANEASDTAQTIMRDLNNSLQCESLFT